MLLKQLTQSRPIKMASQTRTQPTLHAVAVVAKVKDVVGRRVAFPSSHQSAAGSSNSGG